MQTQTITASSIEQGIPQIVKAIRDAVAAAGYGSNLVPENIGDEIAEALKAAAPYMTGDQAIPFVVNIPEGNGGYKTAAKTETSARPASVRSAHPAPVRTANAKWNDRCGRWQNSQTGAFIPFA